MGILNNTKGIKLWNRAIRSIPGGNSLLSKRPARYAPDIWPTFFSKAMGCRLWDIDGNELVDMAQMGIGTALLGYCNDHVDGAVIDAINKGVSTTLNAPEEVALAEKLIELNTYAGGVKFARTGGEAIAIAIRVARACCGRDKVAFSGYHGWSDWYLASNLSNTKNLEGHLLPGLLPNGVPRGLLGTSIPFEYNNVNAFLQVMENHPDIGTIIIEGARYSLPTNEFLNAIQDAANERGVVLISDEITSGWRIGPGAACVELGFNPDIVVFGKGMGNGYAISAVVGKKDVMDYAQESFISSTFWTERIGFVAALKTIDFFIDNKVSDHLILIGDLIGRGWQALAAKHGLNLKVTEFKPLITMLWQYGDLNPAIITLFTQEMLKRGYLAAPSVYVSYSHTREIVEEYLNNVDQVFGIISFAIKQDSLMERLETRVREEGFKRLN